MGMIAGEINRIIGISESYQLPERLMGILLETQERERIFEEFLKINPDLSYDWFTDYFQEEHSNRTQMMQDFTPQSVTRVLQNILPACNRCADICSGTGGLTIALHGKMPDAEYYCAELSERAFPLLLFNLCIRNMRAIVVRQDILTQEVFQIYRITPAEKYSNIDALDSLPEYRADLVVMNPPYSVKHKWDEKKPDQRFEGYGYPPNNFSDFAFVLHGLSMLDTGGTLAAIVPHGLLFRGGKEATIREQLARKGNLSAIIGLPDNMFLNTGIPVCIMVITKDKGTGEILFIDASKKFEKRGKTAIIPDDGINQIAEVYGQRKKAERFSDIATATQIEHNEFNLNISRYVDTFEPPSQIDIVEVVRGLAECTIEIRKLEKDMLDTMKELTGTTPEKKRELAEIVQIWEGMINGYTQLTMPTHNIAGDSGR